MKLTLAAGALLLALSVPAFAQAVIADPCPGYDDTVPEATKIATANGWEVLGVEQKDGVDYFVFQRPEAGRHGSPIVDGCVSGYVAIPFGPYEPATKATLDEGARDMLRDYREFRKPKLGML